MPLGQAPVLLASSARAYLMSETTNPAVPFCTKEAPSASNPAKNCIPVPSCRHGQVHITYTCVSMSITFATVSNDGSTLYRIGPGHPGGGRQSDCAPWPGRI